MLSKKGRQELDDARNMVAPARNIKNAPGGLPCPFCSHLPVYLIITRHKIPLPIIKCENWECKIKPWVAESNEITEGVYFDLLQKWNTRNGIVPPHTVLKQLDDEEIMPEHDAVATRT